MPELEPITRAEKFLNGEVGMTPITREEKILAGEDIETITRREYFLKKYRGGGGGDVTVVPLSVTENGTYSEEGKAYSPVSVNVPLPQNAYLLKSVNTPTPIASFNDGEEMVMPSLKVAIEPQQEGSGDPSPTNICPISGWDSVGVTVCGKNLCDSSTNIVGFYTSTGAFMNDGTKRSSQLIEVNPNEVYIASIFDTNDNSRVNGLVYTEWDENGNFIQEVSDLVIITTANTKYIRIRNYSSQELLIVTNHYAYQLEHGSTATTYEPYAGTTYTIDLDGTRYGGEVDVVSGVLTVDRAYVDMGNLNWTFNRRNNADTGNIFYTRPSDMKNSASSICSIFTEMREAGTWEDLDVNKYIIDSMHYLVVCSTEADATSFKTAMAGQKVVYELATPQTIQLTPTQVKSLCGSNNVYANTGDIKDAEYFSKEV